MQIALDTRDHGVSINKYLPFALIYFFLNAAGLPAGLTWMGILSPFLYYWVAVKRGQEILWPFIACILPFVLVHTVWYEVKLRPYFISLLNLTAVYIFCHAVYMFLNSCRDKHFIFVRLLQINFFLCLLAIPFYFTGYFELFWIEQELTKGIDDFRRLKMFTYEASYYATLCVPLFFYFLLRILLRQNRGNAWMLLVMITIPFILSFSLGVISVLLFSLVIVAIIHFKRLLLQRRVIYLLITGSLLFIPAVVAIAYFFPENTLFYRLENVFSGKDTSGRGRTFEAFELAFRLLQMKSEWWGIGLGQIKVIGIEVIRDFYLYPLDHTIFAIPNATAETLTIFGIAGLFIRFLLQVFFFFYTRVWTNYFRLLLFVFIFMYQFTGSFLTNHAEYVIWVLAFTPVFPEFHISKTRRL